MPLSDVKFRTFNRFVLEFDNGNDGTRVDVNLATERPKYCDNKLSHYATPLRLFPVPQKFAKATERDPDRFSEVRCVCPVAMHFDRFPGGGRISFSIDIA